MHNLCTHYDVRHSMLTYSMLLSFFDLSCGHVSDFKFSPFYHSNIIP